MGTAWTYDKDMHEEHVAIRTKAGLMDVSGLKKVHLVGPHSHAVLHHATTRDVTKIYPGKAAYATMLDERGLFIDDCILYRTGPNSWMVVHGSGAGHEQITRSAVGRNVAVLFDDDLHDLSLQGPLAVDFLADHVPGIRDLPYFHHMPTRLFGAPVTISRTGYTGERGYEIFCAARTRRSSGTRSSRRAPTAASSRAASPCSTCCGSRATCCSSPTTTRRCTPSSTSRPGDIAVGARPRLHGQPRQDRLPRRRGALPAQGQGALQDLRVLLEGDQPAGDGDARLRRRQQGRRHHLRHAIPS